MGSLLKALGNGGLLEALGFKILKFGRTMFFAAQTSEPKICKALSHHERLFLGLTSGHFEINRS